MDSIITTVEMDGNIKHWLEWYCHQHSMTFSQALNFHLSVGQQVTENKTETLELPLSQKLLLQCAMESLLILKELLPDKERYSAINEKAKILIRHTLGIQDPCQPS